MVKVDWEKSTFKIFNSSEHTYTCMYKTSFSRDKGGKCDITKITNNCLPLISQYNVFHHSKPEQLLEFVFHYMSLLIHKYFRVMERLVIIRNP